MSRGETVRYGPVLYRDYPIGTLGLMDDGQGVSRVFLRREGVQYDFPEGETALTLQAAVQQSELFYSAAVTSWDGVPTGGVAGPAGHSLWADPELWGNCGGSGPS